MSVYLGSAVHFCLLLNCVSVGCDILLFHEPCQRRKKRCKLCRGSIVVRFFYCCALYTYVALDNKEHM